MAQGEFNIKKLGSDKEREGFSVASFNTMKEVH